MISIRQALAVQDLIADLPPLWVSEQPVRSIHLLSPELCLGAVRYGVHAHLIIDIDQPLLSLHPPIPYAELSAQIDMLQRECFSAQNIYIGLLNLAKEVPDGRSYPRLLETASGTDPDPAGDFFPDPRPRHSDPDLRPALSY